MYLFVRKKFPSKCLPGKFSDFLQVCHSVDDYSVIGRQIASECALVSTTSHTYFSLFTCVVSLRNFLLHFLWINIHKLMVGCLPVACTPVLMNFLANLLPSNSFPDCRVRPCGSRDVRTGLSGHHHF